MTSQFEMNSVRSRHRMKGKWWWQTKVPALHRLDCCRGRPRSNSWLHWEITGILQAFLKPGNFPQTPLSSSLSVMLSGARTHSGPLWLPTSVSVRTRVCHIICQEARRHFLRIGRGGWVGRGQERERTHRLTSREGRKRDIVCSQCSSAQDLVSKIG